MMILLLLVVVWIRVFIVSLISFSFACFLSIVTNPIFSLRYFAVFSVSRVSPVHRFKGHRDEVNVVKFSPCGTLLASCSDDATIRIWSLKNIPGLTLDSNIKIPENRLIDSEENKGVLVLSGHKHDVHTLAWGNWKKGEGGIKLIASLVFNSFFFRLKIDFFLLFFLLTFFIPHRTQSFIRYRCQTLGCIKWKLFTYIHKTYRFRLFNYILT